MNFETIIGLECHVELKTDSKMFSPSPAHFGAEPNTNTSIQIQLNHSGCWLESSFLLDMDVSLSSQCDISILT